MLTLAQSVDKVHTKKRNSKLELRKPLKNTAASSRSTLLWP